MISKKIFRLSALATIVMLVVAFQGAESVTAFHEGGLVRLSSHTFAWIDPDSGGEIEVVAEVFEGCEGIGTDSVTFFHPHAMTFQYVVTNLSFDPIPGVTNGFSGFQILFPGPVPELYNQQSPAVGGPWHQNAYSGQFPPWGVEWDAPLPGSGLMPDETGIFSYCTYEREDVVVEAPDAGWIHTWGLPIPEPIIDADGSLSNLDGVPGFVEVSLLDPLSTWPTGFWNQGLDMFDTDGSGTWTAGDDLHVEGVAHPGAIRDGFHDDLLDPIVLDIDGSLDSTPGKEPVSCDMETGSFCPSGFPWNMAFFDANGNTYWDDGEDIVLDLNGDLIFGSIINTQNFIVDVPNAVPGELLYPLDMDACSDGHEVCKKVKYLDEDRDGIIEVGEPINFLQVIQVHNGTGMAWEDVIVEDRFGAEIGVSSAIADVGTVAQETKGKSEKVFLEWDIGTLGPGETANLVMRTYTDLTPSGDQSYTECSYHEYNSGAVLKFNAPKKNSFETGEIIVSVLTEDALGDCDGDRASDKLELDFNTDPHDPFDFPSCAHAQYDTCIDADGTISSGAGIPAYSEVIIGDPLASWPTGIWQEGLDSFDNDGSGTWTAGDDLHVEGAVHPGAFRDGWHDDFLDPIVLDIDGSLNNTPGKERVSCDFETGSFCPAGYLAPLGFFDTNGNGYWDDGEDIILDANGNGIFD